MSPQTWQDKAWHVGRRKRASVAGAEKLTKQESVCEEMILEAVVRRKI